jgi:hypothetical protein
VETTPAEQNQIDRQGRAAGNQRGNGNAAAERNAVRNPQPNTPQPNATAPRSQQQQQQQGPRGNAPLFETKTGTAAAQGQPQNSVSPQSGASVRSVEPRSTPLPAARGQAQTATPRAQSQPQYNSGVWSSPVPAYPHGTPAAAQGQQQQQPVSPRVETPRAAGRYNDHMAMPPKQYEQTPRGTPSQGSQIYQGVQPYRPAPQQPQPQQPQAQSAPARSAPEHSRPATTATGGGGGNHGNGGREGRAERVERSR